eukprot:5958797-Pleurochrysis_carterae.AAC.1
MTCLPPYSTPRKPPRLNSYSNPSSRLQLVRKLRVYLRSTRARANAETVGGGRAERVGSERFVVVEGGRAESDTTSVRGRTKGKRLENEVDLFYG